MNELRRGGAPVRVSDLLFPTVLTLAARGPASAQNFLAALASSSEEQRAAAPATTGPNFLPAVAGTRVTRATTSRRAVKS